MRILYFVMGLMFGVYKMSLIGLQVTNDQSREFDRQITPYVLTGYSEGWERGRDYTEAKIYWMVGDCAAELRRANKRNQQ